MEEEEAEEKEKAGESEGADRTRLLMGRELREKRTMDGEERKEKGGQS